jgi:bifunctional non-homologous end joining protein LigD
MADYSFEPKLDGWRCLLTVEDGGVAVRTRTGRDVTDAVPELAPAGEQVGADVILDGELVAGDGRPSDFYAIGPRMMGRSPRLPLTFVAFDVLWHDDRALVHRPYRERRAVLEGLSFRGPAWQTVPSFVGDGPALFGACQELGLEGLVAKRLTSRYQPGRRSPHWIKAKCSEWRELHAPLRHEQ